MYAHITIGKERSRRYFGEFTYKYKVGTYSQSNKANGEIMTSKNLFEVQTPTLWQSPSSQSRTAAKANGWPPVLCECRYYEYTMPMKRR